MDLKIKLLELFEGSYYLIVIAQGIIDSEALKRVFTDIQESPGHFSIARCSSISKRQVSRSELQLFTQLPIN